MSSKKKLQVQEDESKKASERSLNTEHVKNSSNSSSQLTINVLVFIIAILVGILIQSYISKSQQDSRLTTENESKLNQQEILKEFGDKIKQDLLNEIKSLAASPTKSDTEQSQNPVVKEEVVQEKKEIKIIKEEDNERKVSIDENLAKNEAHPEIKFTEGKQIVLNNDKIKFTEETKIDNKLNEAQNPKKNKITKEEKESLRKEKQKAKLEKDINLKKTLKQQNQDLTQDEEEKHSNIPDVVKNFQSKKISKIKTKKMWIPIANS
jgi:hypothetical protein